MCFSPQTSARVQGDGGVPEGRVRSGARPGDDAGPVPQGGPLGRVVGGYVSL